MIKREFYKIKRKWRVAEEDNGHVNFRNPTRSEKGILTAIEKLIHELGGNVDLKSLSPSRKAGASKLKGV